MLRGSLLILKQQRECHYICVSNINFINNVLRTKEKAMYLFQSNVISQPEPNIELWWEQTWVGSGTSKNICVNILAVTFQASNQEIPKSNFKKF